MAPRFYRHSALPRWSHFVIAILLSATFLGLRVFMAPLMTDSAPFLMSALAVTLSAYIGGLWPGLLSTAISTIGGVFLFLSPNNHGFLDDPKMRVILGSQITICVCISLICGALRGSELEAAENADKEREARERMNALFNSITDAFVTLSSDLRVLSFNSAAQQLWELTQDDVNQPMDKVLPPSIHEGARIPLARSVTLAQPITLEIVDSHTHKTFEVRAFPSNEGILVYFHDIGERIAANEAIANLAVEQDRANALLDTLLTHAPVGFGFFDKEFRFERVNQVLADINGMPVSEHAGKSIRDLVPSSASQVEPIISQIFATGKGVEQFEVQGETPKAPGVTRYWHTGFYPVTDALGGVRSVGAIVIEITERKRMEDQLRVSEQRFRNFADNSPMMIWVCNPDGTANWFNQPWLTFRNLSLDDAICEGCFANIHPEDAPWVNETYREAFKRGEPFSVEYRTFDSTGEYRWLHVKANPTNDGDGSKNSYLMSSIDVTDRISMEENLRRSLANERSARSDAETANRLKDEFLAGLSHELRTPLTTMLGWTELLMRPKVRETELVDGLEVIYKSSKLQLQLINDLLDMSRISVGKIHLEFEFAEIFDAVKSVVDLVQPSAAEKKIVINVFGPTKPILGRIDPDRFTQILWNLLSNAIKFTPEGGRVSVEVQEAQGQCKVSVVDTGIGIEESFIPLVFDRFRQADATRSRRHGGLGLGLAIAKQLAELHEGTLDVESEGVNKGCTFTFAFPVAEITARPTLPKSKVAAREDDARRLVDVCILLVEDDPSSRDILKRILEIEGALVIAADSAPAARKLLRETSPDLMVSDIGLPEEDGYQLIRSIRSAVGSDTSVIPALALTAFAASEDRMRAFEAGFNAFLTKPVEPDELVGALIELRTNDL